MARLAQSCSSWWATAVTPPFVAISLTPGLWILNSWPENVS
jgi:hypothetical protein